MKVSEIGTEEGSKKFCQLNNKTLINCLLEDKCYFETAHFKNGNTILKSPKTRDKQIQKIKNYFADQNCGG